MTERDHSVFAENRDYLKDLSHVYSTMSDGVAFQLAEAIDRSDIPVDPSGALQLFCEANDGCDDIPSFARVCKFLTISSEKYSESSDSTLRSVVYFRTPVSDKAYSIFSKKFNSIGAMYATDFKTVCEDVYYDRADACMLPLESSEDGLIMSFRHMMLKYELTITSAVSIDVGEDKYQTMALLTNGNVDSNGNICEMCLTGASAKLLTEYSDSLQHFDATLIRVTSVPAKTRGRYDHHICVSIPPENVQKLRFFTDAVSPANVFLGQYKINK